MLNGPRGVSDAGAAGDLMVRLTPATGRAQLVRDAGLAGPGTREGGVSQVAELRTHRMSFGRGAVAVGFF